MASPTLTARFKSFAEKLSGASVVDNEANPASAASKMKASLGKTNPNALPAKTKPFVSSLPNKQKTFGVPGAK